MGRAIAAPGQAERTNSAERGGAAGQRASSGAREGWARGSQGDHSCGGSARAAGDGRAVQMESRAAPHAHRALLPLPVCMGAWHEAGRRLAAGAGVQTSTYAIMMLRPPQLTLPRAQARHRACCAHLSRRTLRCVCRRRHLKTCLLERGRARRGPRSWRAARVTRAWPATQAGTLLLGRWASADGGPKP